MAARKHKKTDIVQRASVPATATTSRKGFSITRFFGDIGAELKKVVWLSRREVVYLTIMVILVAGIAGLVLGGVDTGFGRLVNNYFIGG
jgi:preprotein translocase subunit SecE